MPDRCDRGSRRARVAVFLRSREYLEFSASCVGPRASIHRDCFGLSTWEIEMKTVLAAFCAVMPLALFGQRPAEAFVHASDLYPYRRSGDFQASYRWNRAAPLYLRRPYGSYRRRKCMSRMGLHGLRSRKAGPARAGSTIARGQKSGLSECGAAAFLPENH